MSYFPPEEYFDHSRIELSTQVPAWIEPLVRASRHGAMVDALPQRRPPRDGEDHPLGRPHRISAVLVLFSGDPDAPGPRPPEDARVLLTHRAATLGSHAGQISFPGGGAEETDETVADTALREAWEETGLDPDSVDILAATGPLYIPVSNYSVYPVLGYWREPGRVGVADEAETSEVLDVPLTDLLDPAQRFTVRQSAGWQGPAFSIGELVLWGFTAGVFAAASEVAGWDLPWDDGDVRDLEKVLAASANGEENSWPSREVRAELEHHARRRQGVTPEGADRAEDPDPDDDFRRLDVRTVPAGGPGSTDNDADNDKNDNDDNGAGATATALDDKETP